MTVPTLLVVIAMVTTCYGTCVVDDFEVQKDFDMSKMHGTWYETYWQPPYLEKAADVWYDYAEVWSAGTNSNVTEMRAVGRPINSTECATFSQQYKKSSDREPAKWYRSVYGVDIDTWIISTNYVSYSVVYGCTIVNDEAGTCNSSHAWVWSRGQELDDGDQQHVEEALDSVCLQLDDLSKMPAGQACEIKNPNDPSIASPGATPRYIGLILPCLMLVLSLLQI